MSQNARSLGVVVAGVCLVLSAAIGMFTAQEMPDIAFGLLQIGIAVGTLRFLPTQIPMASAVLIAAAMLLAAHGIASCFELVLSSGDRSVLLLIAVILFMNLESRQVSGKAASIAKGQASN